MLALLLCAPMAQAQESTPLPSFSLERLEWNPGLSPLTLGNGELLTPGALRVALAGHYQRNPLKLSHEGERLTFLLHRTEGLLSLAYGVLPWLELDALLPAVASQRGDDLSSLGISSPSRSGLGEPWLSARLGLLNPASPAALHLALELGAGLPVGSEEALASAPGVSARGNVLLGGRIGLVAPAFEAGVLLRRTVVIGANLGTLDRIGGEVRLGAGLTVGRALRGELSAHAAFSWEQSRSSAEVLGGLRYAPVPLVDLFALVGTGFGVEPGTPRFRALVGLAFHVGEPPPPEPEDVVYELVKPLPRKAPAEPAKESPAPEPTAAPPVQQLSPEETEEPEASPPEEQLVTLTHDRLILHGQVFFDTGSSALPGPSRVLDQLAQVLLQHPEIQRVVIEGHTDTVGNEPSNRALSLARAETVRRYLIEKGVPAQRLVAQGLGPQQPTSTNSTPEGREQNRRAELRLILGEPAPAVPVQAPSR